MDSFAQRTLKDGNFRETFAAMLDRVGLSEERIIRVLVENLQATKVVSTIVNDGQITGVLVHPDYSVRQRAVQVALDLYGRRRPSEPVEHRPRVELHMNLTEAVLTEQLTGSPHSRCRDPPKGHRVRKAQERPTCSGLLERTVAVTQRTQRG